MDGVVCGGAVLTGRVRERVGMADGERDSGWRPLV